LQNRAPTSFALPQLAQITKVAPSSGSDT